MPIDAGRMRHRVTIQAASLGADDGGGGSAETWSDGATVWAAIEPLEGSERLRGLALAQAVTHRIRMRYRSDVTAAKRLKLGARFFNIRQVINADERDAELEILAEETT